MAFDDPGSLRFDGAAFGTSDGAFPVDGLTESIHHTAQESLTHRNGKNLPRAAHGGSFPNVSPIGENRYGNGFFFQILSKTVGAVFKLQQLSGHTVSKTVYPRNPVPNKNYGSGFAHVDFGAVLPNLFFYNVTEFFGSVVHWSITFFISSIRCRRLPS